jgi:hypothetical protein
MVQGVAIEPLVRLVGLGGQVNGDRACRGYQEEGGHQRLEIHRCAI